jgi:glycerophosphoryl diester phosphodiesterase
VLGRSVLVLIAGLAAVSGRALPGDLMPLIIGHRGFAGHRPEHTLEGYRLAAEAGADYIEPDLVSTKDGVLVARHENDISETTDVASRFPDRKRTKTVDGLAVTGYFTEDFTLAEIKTLKARERLAFRSHDYDGLYGVPTFAEVVELAQQLEQQLHRPIGVYPETKHPTYFRNLGLPLEQKLLDVLSSHDWGNADAPVFIQSFEASSLQEIRRHSQDRLILLLEATEQLPDERLREIATYANGIGADRRLVVPADSENRLLPPTDLVVRAHRAGLLVHVWTLRSDPEFLSPSYRGDAAAEYRQFRDLGVDGIFTDFADVAFQTLRR